MLVFVTKASDSYWYDFREVNTLDDLMKIYHQVIVEENDFYNNPIEAKGFFTDFWDGFKKEDISKVVSVKYQVTIYDDYVE